MKPRPFLRTHRPLPPTTGKSPVVASPYTAAEIRTAGIRAVSSELDRRPIAEDVGRVLLGRTDFPRMLWSEVL